MQKSRLIEKIAELMIARRLPLLGDVLDESAEDIRLVLEPKSRTVDPLVLMEQLFKLTELETRQSLNMNVLSRGQVPNVLSLRQVLNQWLVHRKEVLIRRSEFRRKKIEHRLEVLDGYLIAFKHFKAVLEPKSRTVDPLVLMEQLFKLTELETRQSLNMNVLSRGQVPNVLSLRQVLNQWLVHRKEVLIRRSEFRRKKIEHRLEVLDGYLIAFRGFV